MLGRSLFAFGILTLLAPGIYAQTPEWVPVEKSDPAPVPAPVPTEPVGDPTPPDDPAPPVRRRLPPFPVSLGSGIGGAYGGFGASSSATTAAYAGQGGPSVFSPR